MTQNEIELQNDIISFLTREGFREFNLALSLRDKKYLKQKDLKVYAEMKDVVTDPFGNNVYLPRLFVRHLNFDGNTHLYAMAHYLLDLEFYQEKFKEIKKRNKIQIGIERGGVFIPLALVHVKKKNESVYFYIDNIVKYSK